MQQDDIGFNVTSSVRANAKKTPSGPSMLPVHAVFSMLVQQLRSYGQVRLQAVWFHWSLLLRTADPSLTESFRHRRHQ